MKIQPSGMFLRWLFALLIFPLISSAANPAVMVTLRNSSTPFRANGILPLHVRIDNTTNALQDGVLETGIGFSGRFFVFQETPLTLATGATDRVLLLPPVSATNSFEVRFRFKQGEKETDAGTATIDSSADSDGRIVLAPSSGVSGFDAGQRLGMEHLTAVSAAGNIRRTSSVQMPVEDLPDNPLAYLAYDVVAIEPRTLAAAREKALNALAAWVDAGGSVFVRLEAGQALPEKAAEFIRRLRQDQSPRAGGEKPMELLGPGLGRAVIWRAEIPKDSGITPEFERALMWLWKTTPDLLKPSEARRNYWFPPLAEFIRSDLIERMAKNAKPIPFAVVAGAFFTFVILAVAFDYFGLKRRYRKFTWILFPIECALFAWALMAYANSRLGDAQRAASLVLVDIGLDGRVLKETVISGYLPGQMGTIGHQAEGSITAVDILPYRLPSGGYLLPSGPTRHRGSIGGSTSVERMVQKWTPCFFRDTKIRSDSPGPKLDWAKWEKMTEDKTIREGDLEVTRISRVPSGKNLNAKEGLPQLLSQSRNNWRMTDRVSQTSPCSSSMNGDDLCFPLELNNRVLTFAVKTEGNITYVYRKISGNDSPE